MDFIKKIGTKRIIATAITVVLVVTGTIAYAKTVALEADEVHVSNDESSENIVNTSGETTENSGEAQT